MPIVFSILDFPLRVCIKARWVGPYVFNRVMADIRSPTSLKNVLQLALSGRAKKEMGALARELFIRRVRGDWKFSVGHLPSEHNTVADALSRLSEPGTARQLPQVLKCCAEVRVPTLAELWSV